MLTEFDSAFVEFEHDAYSLLHEYHFDAGTDPTSFGLQVQAQSLATDIGYLSMVTRDLHQAAIREVSDEMDRDNAGYQSYLQHRKDEAGPSLVLDNEFFRNQPRRERNLSIALAKLGATIKVLFFPIRSYQDAIYKIGLRICGQPIGGKCGMKNAIEVATHAFKTNNPIGGLLSVAIPGYPQWFVSLRNQRNFIKDGAGIAYSSGKNFVTGETTVSITLRTSDKQPSISLDDVSQALRMSTKVTTAIIEAGITCGKINSRK